MLVVPFDREAVCGFIAEERVLMHPIRGLGRSGLLLRDTEVGGGGLIL
jgi:hypothetical protein